MAAIAIDARKLMHEITFKVRGLHSVGIRMKLAAYIFRLGARVAGTQIEIELTRGVVETTKPGDEWRTYKAAD